MSYLDKLQNQYNCEEKSIYPIIDDKVELRLELANICNDSCCFCPNRKMRRKRRQMSEELVVRLLSEAAELGIKKVGLFMNGEPFVTDKLAEYIGYAKKKGFTYTYITTNGALATGEKLSACFEAGLDSIKFSINAGSKESYKMIHGHDDYEKVMQHLKYAFDYREKTGLNYRILSSFVVTKYTVDEIEEHYENVSKYVDELIFFNAESFAGQMTEEVKNIRANVNNKRVPQYKISNSAPCKRLWDSINVTCEGYLTLCCSEAFNYLAVEDLNEMSLKDAWHSDLMSQMRRKHMENNLQGTQCAVCLDCSNTEKVYPLNSILFNKSLDD